MAVVVRHRKSGNKYILVGTGFGAYKSSKPHWFFGDWIAEEKKGQFAMVAVCDRDGRIGWITSDELEVLTVDGDAPSRLV